MDPRCRIEMLGPLRLVRSGQSQTRFGSQKAESLLAYLALRLGPHSREQIIDLFWPEMDLPEGRNNLSTTLSGLRRILEPAGITKGTVLVTTHAQIGLDPAAVTTDTSDFERLLSEAAKAGVPEERAKILTRALSHYAGSFQAGNYSDWAIRESERLEACRVSALDMLAGDFEAMGRYAEAISVTQQRLRVDAFAEDAQVGLIRRQIRASQPAAARETARRFEQTFQEEFGVGPSAATLRAIEALFAESSLSRTLTSIPPSQPKPITLPEQPPAEAPVAQEKAALPFWLSRFFGRESELTQLAGLLLPAKGAHTEPHLPERPARLVTLIGLGGTGKTRLATEFGRLAADRFGHWCGFVPLADLTHSDQIPARIAQALGLPPSSVVAPLEQVVSFFIRSNPHGAPPTLLILDNLEHLLGPDNEESPVVAIVRALLTPTTGLSILCTSRRRLGIGGERLLPLAPLPVPELNDPGADLAQLARIPSVRLYVDRAQAVRPDFGLTSTNAPAIAALCRTLEGSPLALELAASWVRLLPPRKMWERLEQGIAMPEGRRSDLPPRHRSLSAALEWSWLLLTPRQQTLLGNLSVFRGSWNLTAAEGVCDEPDALQLLSDLEDASLVTSREDAYGEVRYSLLETIRAFSQQKLEDQGLWQKQRKRHADFFGTLSTESEPELRGPDQKQFLDALESDHDNLRAALDWYTVPSGYSKSEYSTAGGFEAGLRMAAALVVFWRTRGYFREGHDRCLALLSHPQAACIGPARADVLNGAGYLTTLLTEYREAETLHKEALSLSRRIHYTPGEADALLGLGSVFYWRQDYSPSADFLAGSLALRLERAGEWRAEHHRIWGKAATYHSQANLAMRRGQYPEALSLFEQALALRRQQGDSLGVAATLGGLGQASRALGDTVSASRYLVEALRIFDAAGQRWVIAVCLGDLSHIAEERDDFARSAKLLGIASKIREQYHFPVPPAEQAGQDEREDFLRTKLGVDIFNTAWAAGRALPWAQIIEYAQE